MVKFVGFNRTAALLVGFCCEGLLAFFPISLPLLTYYCTYVQSNAVKFSNLQVPASFLHPLKLSTFPHLRGGRGGH